MRYIKEKRERERERERKRETERSSGLFAFLQIKLGTDDFKHLKFALHYRLVEIPKEDRCPTGSYVCVGVHHICNLCCYCFMNGPCTEN